MHAWSSVTTPFPSVGGGGERGDHRPCHPGGQEGAPFRPRRAQRVPRRHRHAPSPMNHCCGLSGVERTACRTAARVVAREPSDVGCGWACGVSERSVRGMREPPPVRVATVHRSRDPTRRIAIEPDTAGVTERTVATPQYVTDLICDVGGHPTAGHGGSAQKIVSTSGSPTG